MRQEIHFESGLLIVRVEGMYSLKEVKRDFVEILEAAVHYQTEKVLFDGRNIEGGPTFMERFYYSEFTADETLRVLIEGRMPRAIRFAYLLSQSVRHQKRFGENVALNRGMIVKTFEILEEALEWLNVINQPVSE